MEQNQKRNRIMKIGLIIILITGSVALFGSFIFYRHTNFISLYALIAYPFLLGFYLFWIIEPRSYKLLKVSGAGLAIWAIGISIYGFYTQKSSEEIITSSLILIACVAMLFFVNKFGR